MITMTTPIAQCKAAGLANLQELINVSGIAKSTLLGWHRQDQVKFKLAIDAALYRSGHRQTKPCGYT